MTQDHTPKKPPRQDPEKGNEADPRLKEPYGPEGYRSGREEPGHPTKKNPGHANPAHNTPGQVRQNQPGQQERGHPDQGQTQSYPGLKGPKTAALQNDEAMDRETAKGNVNDEMRQSERKLEAPKDVAPDKR